MDNNREPLEGVILPPRNEERLAPIAEMQDAFDQVGVVLAPLVEELVRSFQQISIVLSDWYNSLSPTERKELKNLTSVRELFVTEDPKSQARERTKQDLARQRQLARTGKWKAF